jgi:hypothetical protein
MKLIKTQVVTINWLGRVKIPIFLDLIQIVPCQGKPYWSNDD